MTQNTNPSTADTINIPLIHFEGGVRRANEMTKESLDDLATRQIEYYRKSFWTKLMQAMAGGNRKINELLSEQNTKEQDTTDNKGKAEGDINNQDGNNRADLDPNKENNTPDKNTDSPTNTDSPPVDSPAAPETPVNAEAIDSALCFTRTDYKNAKDIIYDGEHGIKKDSQHEMAFIAMLYNKEKYKQDHLHMGITAIDFNKIPWEQRKKAMLIAVLERAGWIEAKDPPERKGFLKKYILPKNISEDSIKKAWKQIKEKLNTDLAPDTNGNETEKSKEFSRQFSTLTSNPPQPEKGDDDGEEKKGFFETLKNQGPLEAIMGIATIKEAADLLGITRRLKARKAAKDAGNVVDFASASAKTKKALPKGAIRPSKRGSQAFGSDTG